MSVPVEHGNAVRTCVLTSKGRHAWQRMVTRQTRWLFGQHLGLALAALELRLLLLPRLRSPSQHG
jgi:hypothetical protein